MNKCFRLIVFGGLLSVAALNADPEGATPAATGTQSTQTPTPPAPPAAPTPTPTPTAAAALVAAADTGFFSKISVQAIKNLVNDYPYHFAAGTTAVVVGLALWKCSWVRKQVGLDEDDKDLRSQDYYDFDAIMNQAKRK